MGREHIGWWDDAAHALEVAASEFVVATAAAADIEVYTPLSALLQRVRRAFGIEAAFVSEWACGGPVVRRGAERGETDALQTLYGMRLLAADAPTGGAFRFEAVPVITEEGSWHGTLCCRCPVPSGSGEASDDALLSVARLIANWFSEAQVAMAV
jgi:hypothetical protein